METLVYWSSMLANRRRIWWSKSRQEAEAEAEAKKKEEEEEDGRLKSEGSEGRVPSEGHAEGSDGIEV